MGRIYIDSDELQTLAQLVQSDALELADLTLDLANQWGTSLGDPEVAALQARSATIQGQLLQLVDEVHGMSADMAAEAQLGATLDGAGVSYSYLPTLQPTVPSGWPPLLQGIFGTPVGAVNTGYSSFLGSVLAAGGLGAAIGTNGFGTTSNAGLNALLGEATGAQNLLVPYITPGAGDINAQALDASINIGLRNVANGTAPIFADGTLAGVNNSLGIAFPSSTGTSTVNWALGLGETKRQSILNSTGVGGGIAFRANPFYNQSVGTVGEPLTGPNIEDVLTTPEAL